MDQEILRRRQKQVLHDEKWTKFLKRSKPFRHIPFVDFVLGAGSMALGNVREGSDFDVIVGARQGRIFTARFFSVLVFEILGWRRPKDHLSEGDIRDRICLNHFVAPAGYRLRPPYNDYWLALYKNLVPIFGKKDLIEKFFKANADWAPSPIFKEDDSRYNPGNDSVLKLFLEYLLGGQLGDSMEKFLKKVQIRKIERSLKAWKPRSKPRVIYNDEVLEFHAEFIELRDSL